MKDCFPLVRIFSLGITDIFQSANNLSSKVACIHGLASGPDIQEVFQVQLKNAVVIVFL
jgi:hypothetical protein